VKGVVTERGLRDRGGCECGFGRQSGRRGEGLGPGFGCEFGDVRLGVGGHADEDIFEIGERLDVGQAAGLNEGVEDGGPVGAGHASGKQPVLTAHRHRPELALGSVVVGTEASVLDEAIQSRPLVVQVAQRICQGGLRERRLGQGSSLNVDLGQDRKRPFLPQRTPVFVRQLSTLVLDPIQLLHQAQDGGRSRLTALEGLHNRRLA
jgi:hypothetical protein